MHRGHQILPVCARQSRRRWVMIVFKEVHHPGISDNIFGQLAKGYRRDFASEVAPVSLDLTLHFCKPPTPNNKTDQSFQKRRAKECTINDVEFCLRSTGEIGLFGPETGFLSVSPIVRGYFCNIEMFPHFLVSQRCAWSPPIAGN